MTDIAGERKRLAAVGFKHTLREQWGSDHDYTSDRTVNRPAKWFFLHISVTADPEDNIVAESAAMRTVERIGIQRFGSVGISYNEAAMQSGRLYEGQPLTRRGAHTVNDENNPTFGDSSLNRDARALVIVQNVQDAVTDAQIDAAAQWAGAVIRAGEAVPGARWYGHRDVSAKACPGDKAYARLGELNALTRKYEKESEPTPEPSDDEDGDVMFVVHTVTAPVAWAVIHGKVMTRLVSDEDINTFRTSDGSYAVKEVSQAQWDNFSKACGGVVKP